MPGDGCSTAFSKAIPWLCESLPIPDPRGAGRFHYAGIGGSGMSALAQFQAMVGGRQRQRPGSIAASVARRAFLERLDISVLPQDGSGVTGDCVAGRPDGGGILPGVAARSRAGPSDPSLEPLANSSQSPYGRDHRHERQVDGGGDGVRNPPRVRAGRL